MLRRKTPALAQHLCSRFRSDTCLFVVVVVVFLWKLNRIRMVGGSGRHIILIDTLGFSVNVWVTSRLDMGL